MLSYVHEQIPAVGRHRTIHQLPSGVGDRVGFGRFTTRTEFPRADDAGVPGTADQERFVTTSGQPAVGEAGRQFPHRDTVAIGRTPPLPPPSAWTPPPPAV